MWEDVSQLFLSFWCLCQEDDCEPWLPRSQWESWDLGSSQWESWDLKSIQPESLVLGRHSCEPEPQEPLFQFPPVEDFQFPPEEDFPPADFFGTHRGSPLCCGQACVVDLNTESRYFM